MSKITGKNAFVLYPSATGVWEALPSTNEWSIDLSISEIDVTTFAEGGVDWKEFLYALKEWTATISGFIDTDNIPKIDIGDNIWLQFHVDNSNSLCGYAEVTGDGLSLNVDDAGSNSLSLRGTSDLNITVAGSSSRGDFSSWTATDNWDVVSNELIYDGLADDSATLSGAATDDTEYIVLIKGASTATGNSGSVKIGAAATSFVNTANKWAVVDVGTSADTVLSIFGKAADGALAISDVIIYEVL